MKAVILAAGKGSRLGELTKETPKCLLPLGKSTLLGQTLKHLSSARITDLIVVTGFCHTKVRDFIESNWKGKAEFVYNPRFDSTNVLYSLFLSLPLIGHDDFIFIHADTVFSLEVLEKLFVRSRDSQMVFAVDFHSCGEEEMKVRVQDNKIIEVTKQMAASDSDGEFLGVAWVSARQIENLKKHTETILDEGLFDAFFEASVQRMITYENLEVEVADVSGLPWCEVDFPEDYEVAKALFDEI